MKRCVPLRREDAHEMGVSFEMKRCETPVRGEGAHVMGLLFFSVQRVEMILQMILL
jgi:hypothetical protein